MKVNAHEMYAPPPFSVNPRQFSSFPFVSSFTIRKCSPAGDESIHSLGVDVVDTCSLRVTCTENSLALQLFEAALLFDASATFSREYVEAVTRKCGNYKSLDTMCRVIARRAVDPGCSLVRIWWDDKIDVIDKEAGEDAAKISECNEDQGAVWLVVELRGEFDKCLYPFKLNKSPKDQGQSANREIDRLRKVLAERSGRVKESDKRPGSSGSGLAFASSLPSPSSPARTAFDSLKTQFDSLSLAYDSLKATSGKKIKTLQRELRAAAYSSAGGPRGRSNSTYDHYTVNKLKGSLDATREELASLRRKFQSERERWRAERTKYESSIRGWKGRLREEMRVKSVTPRRGGRVSDGGNVVSTPGSARSSRSSASSRISSAWDRDVQRRRHLLKSSPSSASSSTRASVSTRSAGAQLRKSRSRPPSSGGTPASRSSTNRRSRSTRPRKSPSLGGCSPASSTKVQRSRSSSPRFDPTEYVARQEAKRRENERRRGRGGFGGYSSDSSRDSRSMRAPSPPVVRRSTRRSKKSSKGLNNGSAIKNVEVPSPSPTATASSGGSRRSSPDLERIFPAAEDGVFKDITEIDKRLSALQGFLKLAKEKEQK